MALQWTILFIFFEEVYVLCFSCQINQNIAIVIETPTKKCSVKIKDKLNKWSIFGQGMFIEAKVIFHWFYG